MCVDTHIPAYEDGTECSEKSAYKFQTPGNYPEVSIKHSEHRESLKLKTSFNVKCVLLFVRLRNNKLRYTVSPEFPFSRLLTLILVFNRVTGIAQ